LGPAVLCGTAVHRRAVGCSWAPENPTHLDRRSGKVHTHTMGRKGGVGVGGGTGGSQQLCRKFQQASALAAVPLHISTSECLNLSASPGGVGTHSGAPCDHICTGNIYVCEWLCLQRHLRLSVILPLSGACADAWCVWRMVCCKSGAQESVVSVAACYMFFCGRVVGCKTVVVRVLSHRVAVEMPSPPRTTHTPIAHSVRIVDMLGNGVHCQRAWRK
jgi:hypothetical protein